MMASREETTAISPQHAQAEAVQVLQPMARMAPPDMGGRAYNSDSQTVGPLTEAAAEARESPRVQATAQEAPQGMGAKEAAEAVLPIVVQAQVDPVVVMARMTEPPVHQPQTPAPLLGGAMAAQGVNTQAAEAEAVHLVEATAATAAPER